nr:acid phosphatase, class B-like protein [Tanacetum cinerariifolium]
MQIEIQRQVEHQVLEHMRQRELEANAREQAQEREWQQRMNDINSVLRKVIPYNETLFNAWVAKAVAPAVPAYLKLYNGLVKLGFKIVFLIESHDTFTEARIKNLKAVGYTTWEKLILKKAGEGSGVVYKSSKRKELVDAGYRIHGNIGDQWSDLLGNNAGDLDMMEDKVENSNSQSTLQVLPSFEENTPPVTYSNEVEEIIGIPIEVEPLDKTPLEDLGLNTCKHDISLSYREISSFDEPKPQPQPLT